MVGNEKPVAHPTQICLATARVLDIPVLTADRIWLQAEIGVQVECIR